MEDYNCSISIIHNPSVANQLELEIYKLNYCYTGEIKSETVAYHEHKTSEGKELTEEDINSVITTYYLNKNNFKDKREIGTNTYVKYQTNGTVTVSDQQNTVNLMPEVIASVEHRCVNFINVETDRPENESRATYSELASTLVINITDCSNPFMFCNPEKLKSIHLLTGRYCKLEKFDKMFEDFSKEKGRDIFKNLVALRVSVVDEFITFIKHFDIEELKFLDIDNFLGLETDFMSRIPEGIKRPKIGRTRLGASIQGVNGYRTVLTNVINLRSTEGIEDMGLVDARLYDNTPFMCKSHMNGKMYRIGKLYVRINPINLRQKSATKIVRDYRDS